MRASWRAKFGRARWVSGRGEGWLTLDDRHDGALLNGRRTLETVGVNT